MKASLLVTPRAFAAAAAAKSAFPCSIRALWYAWAAAATASGSWANLVYSRRQCADNTNRPPVSGEPATVRRVLLKGCNVQLGSFPDKAPVISKDRVQIGLTELRELAAERESLRRHYVCSFVRHGLKDTGRDGVSDLPRAPHSTRPTEGRSGDHFALLVKSNDMSKNVTAFGGGCRRLSTPSAPQPNMRLHDS